MIGLYKIEVIRRLGPGRLLEDIEFATVEWAGWSNYHRDLRPIGHVPPVEYEEAYYRAHEAPAEPVRPKPAGLR